MSYSLFYERRVRICLCVCNAAGLVGVGILCMIMVLGDVCMLFICVFDRNGSES